MDHSCAIHGAQRSFLLETCQRVERDGSSFGTAHDRKASDVKYHGRWLCRTKCRCSEPKVFCRNGKTVGDWSHFLGQTSHQRLLLKEANSWSPSVLYGLLFSPGASGQEPSYGAPHHHHTRPATSSSVRCGLLRHLCFLSLLKK